MDRWSHGCLGDSCRITASWSSPSDRPRSLPLQDLRESFLLPWRWGWGAPPLCPVCGLLPYFAQDYLVVPWWLSGLRIQGSLLWTGSLLWHKFASLAWELSNAMGVTKKKKRKKKGLFKKTLRKHPSFKTASSITPSISLYLPTYFPSLEQRLESRWRHLLGLCSGEPCGHIWWSLFRRYFMHLVVYLFMSGSHHQNLSSIIKTVVHWIPSA